MAMIWDQGTGEWIEDGKPSPWGSVGMQPTSINYGGDNEQLLPYEEVAGNPKYSEFVTVNGREYGRPGDRWDGFKAKGIPTEWNDQYGYLVPADQYRAEQDRQRQQNAGDFWHGVGPWALGAAAFGGAALSGLAGAGAAETTAGSGTWGYPQSWNMLAEGGGVASDAAAAGAGSLGAEVTLPTVNVVDTVLPAAGSGFSGLPAAGGGIAGALLAAGLMGGGGASGGIQLPNNITPETASQFSDSFKEMATREGWSLEDITKALGNPAVRTLLGSAASLGSAAFGANAAGNASDAQVAATNASIAEQRRQFDATRADNAPFLATGTAANGRLRALLGLDPSYTGADSGSLTRKFSAEDMNADPVYQSGLQFGLNEGTKGINARAIGSGMYDSGATLKALTRYGNDYGSTKGNEAYQRYTADQGNIYNKLAGVSGAGQTAVNTVANAGQASTNAISNSLTDAGNARAASIVGGANAWSGAAQGINNSLNQYGSNQVLEALLRRGY